MDDPLYGPEGRILSIDYFWDHIEALEALGLWEEAVSRENVKVVLRCVAAVNAREVPEEFLAPDLRIENVSSAVTDKTYHGAEGFRQWMSDFFEVLDEDARHDAEPIEVGDDYVVCKLRIVGHGSASGAPVDLRWYGVMWIRDGKLTRAVGYATRREALQAVGLSD